jgi:hypothetical protein
MLKQVLYQLKDLDNILMLKKKILIKKLFHLSHKYTVKLMIKNNLMKVQ